MTAKPKKPKQTKPYKNFPLFLHATGQWAKKIRGKLHYFGTDAAAAVERYKRDREDLQAGRTPRLHPEGIALRDLINRFLTSKKLLVDTGELSRVTWRDYYGVAELALDALGRTRPVESLTTADFEAFRAKLSKTRGAHAVNGVIQRVRSIMKYAFDEGLIEKPVRFGGSFKKISAKVIRKARHETGPRLIEAADLRKLLDLAGAPMRAMILLGINAGFGQSDVAALPFRAIDLEKGWLDFPRPKTHIARRCPLWPETIEAIREAMVERPEPAAPADAGLVFITKYGKAWVRANDKGDGKPAVIIDSVRLEFNKLLTAAKLKTPGIGFYALRHTCRTIADKSRDTPAIDAIMGHSDPSMGARYRERVDDERLEEVARVVHDWLFGK